MGAEKWEGGSFYVSRWYLNPKYKDFETPKGTAFYGAAAQKLRNKYIIKYYISDNKGSEIQIPNENMWKVKHNGKNYTEQDDDDLFYYVKDADGTTRKDSAIGYDEQEPVMVAVQKCYKDGWCELYPTSDGDIFYVKRSILYQGPTILNEKQKAELARAVLHVRPATPPWITPSAHVCVKNGGEMNSRGVCQAKWKAASRICEEMGGRLPTIGELKQVVIECGGKVNGVPVNPKDSGYEGCYRRKGFSYEVGYFSSTVKIPRGNVYPSEAYAMHMSDSTALRVADLMHYPLSVLCHVNSPL